MPRGDKTGPVGMGPMTGRRMGYCVGNEHPGFNKHSVTGRGFHGRVHGKNRSFSRRQNHFNQLENSKLVNKELIENEIQVLKKQLIHLEEKLKTLN